MTFKTLSTPSRPLVIGHRGASAHALENSLEAFRLATGPGPWHCDGAELDIQTTSDGVILVHHDPALPTGEAISRTPAEQIRGHRLSDGSAIPTLAEALEVLGSLEVFIEAKGLPPTADDTLLATIGTAPDPLNCHVHSFDLGVIRRLHGLAPNLSLGVLTSRPVDDPVRFVREAGAATLWPELRLVDAGLLARCHEAGIAVIVWTVNDEGDAKRMARLGVNGLCGDWPERLRG